MRGNGAVPPGLESFLPLCPAQQRWAKLVRHCRGLIPELLWDEHQHRDRMIVAAVDPCPGRTGEGARLSIAGLITRPRH
jgi:hypothetical protein